MMKLSNILLLAFLCIGLLFGMSHSAGGRIHNCRGNSDSQSPAEIDIDTSYTSVTIVAVGDNLIHNSVLKSGKQADGTYDFGGLFEMLKSEFQSADLAIINQETILGGPFKPYAGYPNFNSPFELGDAIVDAGFDVVTHATNHTMDVGVKGITNCLEYWKKHPEVNVLGIYESQEKRDEICVVEKNGIKMALLNYTYGLNGYTLPESQPYLVNLIDTAQIIRDLQNAEEVADVTIVFPHWGTEYVYKPNKGDRRLAEIMVEYGADIIIGTHPHVLQPVEWVTAANGNRAVCYYSLGNYTSGQKNTPRVLGGMAKLSLEKRGTAVTLAQYELVPLVTHYEWVSGSSKHQTYKLADYTPELEKRHSLNAYDKTFSIKTMQELYEKIVKE